MTMSDIGSVTMPSIGTYLGIDAMSTDSPPDIAILGVPYDTATHPMRVGSRQGPDHVRWWSRELRRHLAEIDADPIGIRRVEDAGNVIVTAGRTGEAFQSIEKACEALHAADVIPVTIGGDGAVTLPQLRAAAGKYQDDLAVLHFDAHTDSFPGTVDEPYTNATTFVRAVEEGVLTPESCLHVGVRGTSPIANPLRIAAEYGFDVITTSELLRRDLSVFGTSIAERFGQRPLYICWDMDVFDPAVAPGVCTPEWGGITAAQGVEIIRSLTGLNVVHVDLNTVSPPHDIGGQTGSLAARILLELLFLT